MSSHAFVERLEQSGILDADSIIKLRRQINRPGKELTARAVASHLVSRGELTQRQADKLVGDIEAEYGTDDSEIQDFGQDQEFGDDIVDLSAASSVPAVAPQLDSLGGFHDQPDQFDDGASALDPGVEPPEEEDDRPKFRKKEVGNQWDSKWILILPFALLIILIVGALLYFLLSKTSSGGAFELVKDTYENGQYSECVAAADKFIAAYGDSEDKSPYVKVMRQLSMFRIPLQSRRFNVALGLIDTDVRKLADTLPSINSDVDRGNFRDDIASIVPGVAEGFVANADKEKDMTEARKLTDLSLKAFEICMDGQVIPTSLRKRPDIENRLETIKQNIGKVQRKIAREDKLVSSIGEMQQQQSNNDTLGAFVTYKKLLALYPSLESDSRLQNQILEVSKQEQQLVRSSAISLQTTDSDPESMVQAQTTLVTSVGKEIRDLQRQIVPMLISGSVYGIDMAKGNIIWRRFVGSETVIHPIEFEDTEKLVLLSNQFDNSISCVRPNNGSLVWQTAIGEPFHKPLVTNDQIFVSTISGKLIALETTTGDSSRAATFPQPLRVGAGGGKGNSYLVQVGEHANLYVLSKSDMKCKSVYHIGHRAYSIIVPPTVVSGFVMIPENKANGKCDLHVLKIEKAENGDVTVVKAQTPEVLNGFVIRPIYVYGRRFFVYTEDGDVRLFEFDVSDKDRPLKTIASLQVELEEKFPTQVVAERGDLWIGDTKLTRFSIQGARGRLAREKISNSSDVFVAPMRVFGETLVHVRRRRESELVSVSAVKGSDLSEIWRIDLGAPLGTAPFIDDSNGKLAAVSSQGDLFDITSSSETNLIDKPTRRASTTEQNLVFVDSVDLGSGRKVFYGNGKRILSYDPSQTALPYRLVDLQIENAKLACEPVSFANRMLAPLTSGEVVLVDPRSAASPANFAPVQKPNQQVAWLSPAVVDDGAFVIPIRNGKLYSVRLQTGGGKAALVKDSDTSYAENFVSRAAFANNKIAVVASEGRNQKIVGFDYPALAVKHEIPFEGNVTWGPMALGDSSFVMATDRGKLLCFDGVLMQKWSVEIGNSYVKGMTMDGGDVAFSLATGSVIFVNPDSGDVNSKVEFGEPVWTKPLVRDNQVYVGGADGTILVAPKN